MDDVLQMIQTGTIKSVAIVEVLRGLFYSVSDNFTLWLGHSDGFLLLLHGISKPKNKTET